MIDPICGMEVEPGNAAGSTFTTGKLIIFAAITVSRSLRKIRRSS